MLERMLFALFVAFAVACKAAPLLDPTGNITAPNAVVLDETFDDAACALLASQSAGGNWDLPTYQWGGDSVNGGVNAGNVNCRKGDPTYGNVLQLFSHGDRYQGKGPNGVDKTGTQIAPGDNWDPAKWHYKSYLHKCAPYCNVQRVGASVRSKIAITAGTTEVVMKPCSHFGTASTIFLFSYQEERCGNANKPNVQNQCSAGYTANCCIGGNCTINPNGKTGDVCRGVWVKNKEIDIELPSSAIPGDPANDPKNINFDNFRANSVQAFPWSYKHHTKCAIHDRTNPDGTSSCEDDNYVHTSITQNDGKFHTYTIDWDGVSTIKVSIDGTLEQTITHFVPTVAKGEIPLQLNIASWFPNSWAGSPDFDTCVTEVASVKITGTTGPSPPPGPPTPPGPPSSSMKVSITNNAGVALKVRKQSDKSALCQLKAAATCTVHDDFDVISTDGSKAGDSFDAWWGDSSWKTAQISIGVSEAPNNYLKYTKL